MGKEIREKARNQRNSAPYNVSNSSFAQRITSKVAEYIAPTWATGWFQPSDNDQEGASTSSNPNCTQVQVEINHVENDSKKSCVPNHNNIATNSNNKPSLSSKSHALLGNETCSPILNSDRHNRVGDRDFQLAGPSGFSQPSRPTHNLFVASTPAFNVNKPSGDNGSESGESTSGCSSLVSQSNKLRLGGMGDMDKSKSLFPNRQIPTTDITKSHNKSSGPQFDSSLFNSSSPSLNKSVNLSPFYPGRTMYGGASSYRKLSIGSNKSATSPSIFQPSLRRASLCNQSKVNPSPTTLPKMSVVAENILKTIHSMSSVSRLMSMPRPEEVNASPVSLRGTGSGVKRKLPELQIPTVVNSNLLHLKGTERKNALSQSVQEVLSSSSSSDEDLDYAIVSNDAKRSLKEKMKRLRRGNVDSEEVQTEVNLPHAVLNVPSLPVIDIELGKSSLDMSFSDPVECRDFNISSETSLLSVSSSSSDQSNVNNPSVNFVYNSESNNSKPKPKVNIMSTPIQVSPKPYLLSPKVLPTSTSSTWDCDECMSKGNPSAGLCKVCRKPQNVNPKIETIAKPATSLIEQFKPSSDTWECKECFVRNKSDATACVCCNIARPGAKVSITPAPLTTTSGGFGDMFKKPSGNWECSMCMISNNSTVDKCVACETAKPGTAAKAPAPSNLMSGPKFPFSTSDTPAFKFGIDKVDSVKSVETVDKPAVTTSAAPSFSFGIPSTLAASSTAQTSTSSTSLPAFSFGMPKTQEITSADKKETSNSSSVLASTVVSTTSAVNTTMTSSLMFSSNQSTASSPSTPSSLLKPTPSLATSPTSTFSFKSTISSPSTVAPVSSAPSFSFGTTNGPLVKPAESTVVPKPEVKESPKPLFGAEATSFLNKTTEKPLASLFGNNTENKLLNSFETKKVRFDATPTTNGGEPPAKMLDFGKPATVEPSKPLIFGSAVFEKPKENSLFGNVNTNAAPPAFPASKPAENAVFSFGSTASKPMSNAFSATPSPSAPVFGFGSAPQSNSFAAPTPSSTPAFSFNATPANNSNFAAAPQTLAAPMFNAGNTMFGTPTPAPATAAPAPMFGAPSNANPSTFSFGATTPVMNNASGGFSFGSQNSNPAASSGGFAFGVPSSANPPAFDPNMRPSFNFTAGTAATPTFNAQPSLTGSSNLAARKYKTAARRKKPQV